VSNIRRLAPIDAQSARASMAVLASEKNLRQVFFTVFTFQPGSHAAPSGSITVFYLQLFL